MNVLMNKKAFENDPHNDTISHCERICVKNCTVFSEIRKIISEFEGHNLLSYFLLQNMRLPNACYL